MNPEARNIEIILKLLEERRLERDKAEKAFEHALKRSLAVKEQVAKR